MKSYEKLYLFPMLVSTQYVSKPEILGPTKRVCIAINLSDIILVYTRYIPGKPLVHPRYTPTTPGQEVTPALCYKLNSIGSSPNDPGRRGRTIIDKPSFGKKVPPSFEKSSKTFVSEGCIFKKL